MNVVEQNETQSENTIEVESPKRVLHFCDGTLEEFSEEEVDSYDTPYSKEAVDTKTLPWGPWIIHMISSSGSKTLSFLDSLGEKIAWGFGVTSPKYYYEIEEYKKTQEETKKELEEQAGWSEPTNSSHIRLSETTTKQPKAQQ